MYKNTPYALRALILGTLLAATGLGFASANTTTTTNAPTNATPVVVNKSIGTPQDIQKIRAHIFTDVPSDFWAANSISTVTKANLMKGYSDGTFRPNQPMTREEVAALFNNITDDGTAAFLSSKFKDITSDRWSALAIESVARKNIISGYGDETYKPEKYITRAEAAEIAYRMTQTEQSLAFHNTLFKQQVENKTAKIISKALNYDNDFTKFRQDGALFWEAGQLHASLTDQKKADLVTNAIAQAHDPQLDRAVVVSKGKLTQEQLEDYQSDAISLYQEKEPKGKILSIAPNTDTSALLITVDSIQKPTLKAFKKKFGEKVFLQLPPEPLTNTNGAIQFPLPPRVNYYNDKQ